jgi:hypothetical protein
MQITHRYRKQGRVWEVSLLHWYKPSMLLLIAREAIEAYRNEQFDLNYKHNFKEKCLACFVAVQLSVST